MESRNRKNGKIQTIMISETKKKHVGRRKRHKISSIVIRPGQSTDLWGGLHTPSTSSALQVAVISQSTA